MIYKMYCNLTPVLSLSTSKVTVFYLHYSFIQRPFTPSISNRFSPATIISSVLHIYSSIIS